jgi:hypothetical protein
LGTFAAKAKEVSMPAKKQEKQEEEVGGFNPERRDEKPKPQVGPAPTDDPRHKADPDLKRKIEEKQTRLPPD